MAGLVEGDWEAVGRAETFGGSGGSGIVVGIDTIVVVLIVVVVGETAFTRERRWVDVHHQMIRAKKDLL